MPREHHLVIPNKDEYGGFYNAVGYLKFNQQMVSEINEITSILRQIVSMICTTHMAFATNCGEGYLPYLLKDSKVGINFFIISPSQEDERVSSEIANKITDSMNIVQVRLRLFTEIIASNQQFLNSLVNDSVTNIWIST